ncbi:TetR/AcrR family transcriptional regulator [Murinocardiopsis flavida]|nr:TetR family transcriptional regulator [Murinocardiopsis flavida]
MSSTDDLTAKARIRDAALRLFGSAGVGRVSMQAIAAQAGVSPALIVHHFGSKDGLRRACDEHVVSMARGAPGRADAASRDAPGLAAMLEGAGAERTYLARALLDGSPAAADLFDEIVDTTTAWLAAGEQEGWVHPSEDPRARAAIYVSWLLAPLAFGAHVSRVLDDDITDFDAILRYSRHSVEMLTHGLFADERWLDAWDAVRDHRKRQAPR